MGSQTFENSQAMPSERKVSDRDADLIATLGADPLMKDTLDKALMIKAVFGDNEAFLADTSSDIEQNLRLLMATWSSRPERIIATALQGMTPEDRATKIAEMRSMLDEIEAADVGILQAPPEEGWYLMATGTRSPSDVHLPEAFERILTKMQDQHPNLVTISGGASGVDQLWAKASIAVGVYFVLILPNWAYAANYGQTEAITELMESPYCLAVRYAVERPEIPNWKDRWNAEKWWVDNFTRNDLMIKTANGHVIAGPNHPAKIFSDSSIKGGTAACVRSMPKHDVRKAIYVNTDDSTNIVWVEF